MQTLGYIWLYDREGNKTQCVQVLYRFSNNNRGGYSYIKKRKESKTLGVHFESEEYALQASRFSDGYTIPVSNEEAESWYQNQVDLLVNKKSAISF